MTQHYFGTKIVQAWEQEKNGESGYAVKYPDGYVSWSPKAVFEEANIPLGQLDNLLPFHQRLIAECEQQFKRLKDLSAYLDRITAGTLPSPGVKQLALLNKQVEHMTGYVNTLVDRLALLK